MTHKILMPALLELRTAAGPACAEPPALKEPTSKETGKPAMKPVTLPLKLPP